MKRSKPYRKPALEFDLHIDDRLPHEFGFHCLYRIHCGKGLIIHSPNCPAADMAFAKAQLERVWQGVEPPSVEEFTATYTE